VLTRAQERMGELASLIAKFGVPTVLVAELVFIIIRGHVNFQYPRDDDPRASGTEAATTSQRELSDGD
jgi:hypothetical protein